jgi:hypothetical protein
MKLANKILSMELAVTLAIRVSVVLVIQPWIPLGMKPAMKLVEELATTRVIRLPILLEL